MKKTIKYIYMFVLLILSFSFSFVRPTYCSWEFNPIVLDDSIDESVLEVEGYTKESVELKDGINKVTYYDSELNSYTRNVIKVDYASYTNGGMLHYDNIDLNPFKIHKILEYKNYTFILYSKLNNGGLYICKCNEDGIVSDISISGEVTNNLDISDSQMIIHDDKIVVSYSNIITNALYINTYSLDGAKTKNYIMGINSEFRVGGITYKDGYYYIVGATKSDIGDFTRNETKSRDAIFVIKTNFSQKEIEYFYGHDIVTEFKVDFTEEFIGFFFSTMSITNGYVMYGETIYQSLDYNLNLLSSINSKYDRINSSFKTGVIGNDAYCFEESGDYMNVYKSQDSYNAFEKQDVRIEISYGFYALLDYRISCFNDNIYLELYYIDSNGKVVKNQVKKLYLEGDGLTCVDYYTDDERSEILYFSDSLYRYNKYSFDVCPIEICKEFKTTEKRTIYNSYNTFTERFMYCNGEEVEFDFDDDLDYGNYLVTSFGYSDTLTFCQTTKVYIHHDLNINLNGDLTFDLNKTFYSTGNMTLDGNLYDPKAPLELGNHCLIVKGTDAPDVIVNFKIADLGSKNNIRLDEYKEFESGVINETNSNIKHSSSVIDNTSKVNLKYKDYTQLSIIIGVVLSIIVFFLLNRLTKKARNKKTLMVILTIMVVLSLGGVTKQIKASSIQEEVEFNKDINTLFQKIDIYETYRSENYIIERNDKSYLITSNNGATFELKEQECEIFEFDNYLYMVYDHNSNITISKFDGNLNHEKLNVSGSIFREKSFYEGIKPYKVIYSDGMFYFAFTKYCFPQGGFTNDKDPKCYTYNICLVTLTLDFNHTEIKYLGGRGGQYFVDMYIGDYIYIVGAKELGSDGDFGNAGSEKHNLFVSCLTKQKNVVNTFTINGFDKSTSSMLFDDGYNDLMFITDNLYLYKLNNKCELVSKTRLESNYFYYNNGKIYNFLNDRVVIYDSLTHSKVTSIYNMKFLNDVDGIDEIKKIDALEDSAISLDIIDLEHHDGKVKLKTQVEYFDEESQKNKIRYDYYYVDVVDLSNLRQNYIYVDSNEFDYLIDGMYQKLKPAINHDRYFDVMVSAKYATNLTYTSVYDFQTTVFVEVLPRINLVENRVYPLGYHVFFNGNCRIGEEVIANNYALNKVGKFTLTQSFYDGDSRDITFYVSEKQNEFIDGDSQGRYSFSLDEDILFRYTIKLDESEAVESVIVDGSSVSYRHVNDVLEINLGRKQNGFYVTSIDGFYATSIHGKRYIPIEDYITYNVSKDNFKVELNELTQSTIAYDLYDEANLKRNLMVKLSNNTEDEEVYLPLGNQTIMLDCQIEDVKLVELFLSYDASGKTKYISLLKLEGNFNDQIVLGDISLKDSSLELKLASNIIDIITGFMVNGNNKIFTEDINYLSYAKKGLFGFISGFVMLFLVTGIIPHKKQRKILEENKSSKDTEVVEKPLEKPQVVVNKPQAEYSYFEDYNINPAVFSEENQLSALELDEEFIKQFEEK